MYIKLKWLTDEIERGENTDQNIVGGLNDLFSDPTDDSIGLDIAGGVTAPWRLNLGFLLRSC